MRADRGDVVVRLGRRQRLSRLHLVREAVQAAHGQHIAGDGSRNARRRLGRPERPRRLLLGDPVAAELHAERGRDGARCARHLDVCAEAGGFLADRKALRARPAFNVGGLGGRRGEVGDRLRRRQVVAVLGIARRRDGLREGVQRGAVAAGQVDAGGDARGQLRRGLLQSAAGRQARLGPGQRHAGWSWVDRRRGRRRRDAAAHGEQRGGASRRDGPQSCHVFHWGASQLISMDIEGAKVLAVLSRELVSKRNGHR